MTIETAKAGMAYEVPVADRLLTAAEAVLAGAAGIIIDSDETYAAYAEDLISIKRQTKDIEAARTKFKKPFLDGGRAIDDMFRAPLEKREQAARLLESALTAYRREVERRRQEDQARLEAQAATERARLKQEADKLAAAGMVEAAHSKVEEAAMVIAAPTAVAAPTAAGVHGRKVWRANVHDRAALLRHIAEHPECESWVEIKQAPLDALARTYKDKLDIPGVSPAEVETTVART